MTVATEELLHTVTRTRKVVMTHSVRTLDCEFYCRKTCGLCKDPNVAYTTKEPLPVPIKRTTKIVCKDDSGTENCEKKKHLCTNPVFPEYKESCLKTCGLCIDPADLPTTIPSCQDKSTGCAEKKYLCTNAFFSDFKYDCEKTCGLC
ncbi:hypothetical protein CRE_26112 [Caenorhabditis remanei]|uniref:ShKT domain-containing protein n=1 Tax=Caenorhabditis remanei TaxID=31234 RepID=E3LQ93_CAERE|nr:hypothetical protein CRE_26112 [Caenorhabditis remanei]